MSRIVDFALREYERQQEIRRRNIDAERADTQGKITFLLERILPVTVYQDDFRHPKITWADETRSDITSADVEVGGLHFYFKWDGGMGRGDHDLYFTWPCPDCGELVQTNQKVTSWVALGEILSGRIAVCHACPNTTNPEASSAHWRSVYSLPKDKP